MTNTVLILGPSGKIGRSAATAFQHAGWKVRLFNRKTGNMTQAAKGVDVIVNGMNPPNYHDWENAIPAITKQVIAAAKTSGATVIIPGNVYNFGARPGTWSENTPQQATTRKGQIRIEMEQAYRAAGVRTIVLRAGNFIEPQSSDDVMSMLILRAIRKDRITHMGSPNVLLAYCYLPDWARAVVELAQKRNQLATFEDIPFPGHAFTTNELRATLATELGRAIKPASFPWWLMKLAAPFWELARELNEMRYLWNTEHELSGEKFARLLPDFSATDLRTVMTAGLPADIHPNQRVAGRENALIA